MSSRLDISSRVTGLLVFLAGVGLLVFVFVMAHALFTAPPPEIPTTVPPTTPGATAAPSPALEIGRSFSIFGQRVVLLLLMCIAGSVIASKGIQLYFAARAHATPGAPPAPEPPARLQPEVPAVAPVPPVPAPPASAPPAPAPKKNAP